MDGGFCSNCDQTYWFTGKRIIEHSITTKTLPDDPLNLAPPQHGPDKSLEPAQKDSVGRLDENAR